MTMLPNDPGMDVVMAAYRAMRLAPPDVRLDEIGAVCPVDDTVLLAELRGWCCPTCLAWWDRRGQAGLWLADDRAPAEAVVAEDDLEAVGRLDAAGRWTCHTCRVWVNEAHVASAAHWAAIDEAADKVTLPELYEVACPVPVPDGVHGMCWWPRPCPEHDVDAVLLDGQLVDEHADDAAARLRRLDHRCALAVGGGGVCGFGYTAGRLSRPWAHLVPDVVVWAAFGGLVAVAVTVFGAVQLWRWWRDWWPYRHNQVLGAELGWDLPAGGGVRDVR